MPTWPLAFFSGTAGGGGGGGTSYITSIQPFSITIGASATSNTATITSVTTGNSVIFLGGFTSSESSTQYQNVLPRVELTNATTVTANRNTATANTVTVYGTVVEFTSSAITSIQAGTITIGTSATSNTATISSVTTANSVVFYLGATANTIAVTSATALPRLDLTNSTTVTATRNTSSGTQSVVVGYAVVNFSGSIINSIQQRSVTFTSANTSDNDTISSVTTGNTMLIYGGSTTATTAYNASLYNLQLTGSTTVALSRGGTSTSSRTINYTAVEFVANVLNSVQRGTLAMTNATSNSATITSVDTSKTVCNFTGCSSSLGTNNPTDGFSAVRLNNATTVNSMLNTAVSGVTATPGYEAVEFK